MKNFDSDYNWIKDYRVEGFYKIVRVVGKKKESNSDFAKGIEIGKIYKIAPGATVYNVDQETFEITGVANQFRHKYLANWDEVYDTEEVKLQERV